MLDFQQFVNEFFKEKADHLGPAKTATHFECYIRNQYKKYKNSESNGVKFHLEKYTPEGSVRSYNSWNKSLFSKLENKKREYNEWKKSKNNTKNS